ncbi:hypothetical protein DFA_04257 [Cavenderia fasciculata]|uniref:Uncharacterized protein n=1 Tax=Cavenderia fasciculata TaxID=261658 RepID=F4PP26_CACFS|nr:uncharacterized protein DFA_04257 [Cavenderia fasciculata]EGG22139.1 hypothetical protein DFA_04257 [Cavenderia fasciculata]|eukprot:XP_004359990.1 hypothetical protein DFA_04257 [Cavenderia fasciculata]
MSLNNNNELILESINQVFINHLLEQDTKSYLVGTISESVDQVDLEESLLLAIDEFSIESDQQQAITLMRTLVSLLRKKGCLEFSDTTKPLADHLVCKVVQKEPTLNDPNLTMDQILDLTRSKSAETRRLALRAFCPCKVKVSVSLH